MQIEGKVALVTGARTGVGLELTRRLLREGWDVAVLIRSPLPSERLLEEAASSGQLRTYLADLADFASLRPAIADILRKEPRLDILFNNAGVSPETFERSLQGRELCYEVNTVVPYILANELLPLLKAGTHRRIVNTSSNASLMVKAFDPANLGTRETYKKLFGAYARSKLALSLWTMAVAGEISGHGVSIVSVCPGPTKTPMTAGGGMPWLLKMAAKVFFKPPSVGAGKLHAVAMDEGRIATGSFVVGGKVRAVPFPEASRDVRDRMDRIYRSEFR